MGNLTLKPASGGDLILQNDDAGAKIQINNDDTIDITGSIDTGTFNGTIGSSASGSANLPAVKTAINASGSAPIYAARAWVNFNGNGTVARRDSGNVSSVTDNGTGDYTINITTALADDDYSLNVSASGDSSGIYASNISLFSKTSSDFKQAPTNNTARIIFRNSSDVFMDPETVCATFFR